MKIAAACIAALSASGCTLIMQGLAQEVRFTSEPPGAVFTVAGQTAVTPATLDVPKDDYDIVFTKTGYHDSRFELRRSTSIYFFASIVGGVIATAVDLVTGAWQEFETEEVHVILEPLPDTPVEIPVRLTSAPAGAEILIDGKAYGITDADLSLPWMPLELEKTVTLRLDKHEPKTVSLARKQGLLHVALDASPTIVLVEFRSEPPDAEIRVGGLLVGRTPTGVNVKWLSADAPKLVEFVREGYEREERKIAAVDTKVEVALRETIEFLPLELKILPRGADVFVDGERVGAGIETVKLRWSVSVRRHAISVSHPGYRSADVEVTREHLARPLEIRLSPDVP